MGEIMVIALWSLGPRLEIVKGSLDNREGANTAVRDTTHVLHRRRRRRRQKVIGFSSQQEV